jgi:hypothetical protein
MQGDLLQKKEKFFDILQFIKYELTNFKSFYPGSNEMGDRK